MHVMLFGLRIVGSSQLWTDGKGCNFPRLLLGKRGCGCLNGVDDAYLECDPIDEAPNRNFKSLWYVQVLRSEIVLTSPASRQL